MRYLRERWRLVLGLAALGVVLWTASLAGLIAYGNRRGAVTRANLRRIQIGMTEVDVQTILGQPGLRQKIRSVDPGEYARSYRNGRFEIIVIFDEGKVEGVSEGASAITPQDALRSILGF